MSETVPTYLRHKPIIGLENYYRIDASRSEEESDAYGISLGFAQWNEPLSGSVDISAKVWRVTAEDKWSRSSEELSLNRVLDMAMVIAQSCLNADKINKSDDEIAKMPSVKNSEGREVNDLSIKVMEWGEDDEKGPIASKKIKLFVKLLKEEKKNYLMERFKNLHKVLGEIIEKEENQ